MNAPTLSPERLLVLVTNASSNSKDDFDELAQWVMEHNRRILALVVEDHPSSLLQVSKHPLPTLVFSPGPLQRFRPSRGAVLMGQWLPKSVEYQRLQQAGLPVPRWAKMTASHFPSVEEFGQYVVVKPDLGARGADVRIARSKGLKWHPPTTRCAKVLGGPFAASVVQEFIYTGPWPRSYRVVTLAGEVLWSVLVEASHLREPLNGPNGFADCSGISIVSSGKGCQFSLAAAPDAFELARRVHQVFPELPLLGIDIARDHATGKLYVIEVNSAGMTWHFSSPGGRRMQQEFGIDLESQFDGRRLAAQLLAAQTVRLAC